MDVCMAAFRATLAAAKRNPVQIEETDCDLEAVGTGLLKTFYEASYQEPPEVLGVEFPFGVEIHDPVTGEVLEERLVGALDLIIKEGGRHIVVEHKTAARKWSEDQVRNEPQLAAYKLVATELGMGDAGLRVQVLTKTKNRPWSWRTPNVGRRTSKTSSPSPSVYCVPWTAGASTRSGTACAAGARFNVDAWGRGRRRRRLRDSGHRA